MEQQIKTTSEFLKIISDPQRLKILVFLQDSSRCVCKIFPSLGISQKLTSHHLSRLRAAGMVTQERRGNFMHYSINKKVIKKHLQLLNKSLQIK